ncbi:MAG: cytochrome c1 [Rhodospirillaceae bacterium]
MMMKTIKSAFMGIAAAGLLASATGATPANAAGNAPKPPAQSWSFQGVFGTFDRAAVQRGYKVYKEVCAACHSLNLIRYRNLIDIGFSEAQAKALAAQAEITDGPNADGEMFKRKRTLSDPMPAPFANANAAAAANSGKAPPDLSLITKARAQGGDSLLKFSMKHPGGFTTGADYIYALMTGYTKPPAGVPENANYNKYFPGGVIAMPNPLSDGGVEYSDGTKATVDQMARDVTLFLVWTAEPELEARKRLGVKVMLFLIILAGMMYALKRKIWSDIH